MNKKGAIEFSMTTIMIVIIGVAVLALGLAWIRGTFRQIGEISEEALDKAGTVLFEGTHIGKINAPATIILKPGEIKKFEVWVRNDNPDLDGKYFGLSGTTLIEGCNILSDVVTEKGVQLKVGQEDKFIAYVSPSTENRRNPAGNEILDTGCGHGNDAIVSLSIVSGNDVDLSNPVSYGQESVVVKVRK